MLWGIVKSKTNRLPLTVLPPKREDRIQTYKHKYRAKSRRLQKSNMQVLKGKTNQIFKKKKLVGSWGGCKAICLSLLFKFSVIHAFSFELFLSSGWGSGGGMSVGIQEVLNPNQHNNIQVLSHNYHTFDCRRNNHRSFKGK